MPVILANNFSKLFLVRALLLNKQMRLKNDLAGCCTQKAEAGGSWSEHYR